jgi:NAD(P)-dependent dehydrogenase (short-subunit alcohol dehydrogenase family)
VSTPAIEADLSGKVAVVTGANSGIGKQIAANLAGFGARVVMACRSAERGEAARAELAAADPAAALEVAELDQSSRTSVAAFAERVTAAHPRLDILVNNAGIYPERRELSVDGIEKTWATNVMGYFWLSRALREPLAAAAAPSRLIFVASKLAGGLDLDDLEWERRKFGGIKAYKQSKQANRMLSHVFAERYAADGIAVHVVHPGGIRTNIGRSQKGLWGVLVRLAFRTQGTPSAGADTATYLAAAPIEDIGETGGYWIDRERVDCEFRDMEQCRELWRRCEAMTGRLGAA